MTPLTSSLKAFPVLPVLTIQSLKPIDSMVELCLSNHINHLEITLRTPVALEAIKYIKTKFPNLIVGAGSILTTDQFESSIDSGADFFISPGISDELCDLACLKKLMYLPGVQTPSEIMLALSYNIDHLKYFPAEPNGVKLISTLQGPFPKVKFCPTGGIDCHNLNEFLSLQNCFCVGMSRLITPAQLLENDVISMQRNIAQVAQIIAERKVGLNKSPPV